jgi:hypothetical protein
MENIKSKKMKLEKVSGRDFDSWLKQASLEELEAALKKEFCLPEQASRQDIYIQFKKAFGLPEDIELTNSLLSELEAKIRKRNATIC